MTTPDNWEAVARETTAWTLSRLVDDAQAATDAVDSTLYWGDDVNAEEVETMRAFAFRVVYVTEAYLARLCDETTPWEPPYARDPGDVRPDPLPTVTGQRDQLAGERGTVTDDDTDTKSEEQS